MPYGSAQSDSDFIPDVAPSTLASSIQEFDVSSATVDLAAQALGCEPCRIAKTLSFLVDGRPILIVAAGDAKIAR